MIVVSYYTPKYSDEVDYLIESCDKFGFDCYTQEKRDRGSWLRNVWIKPHFILECLDMFQTDILWIDADGRFEKRPPYMPTAQLTDTAAVHEWRDHYVKRTYNPKTFQLEPCRTLSQPLGVRGGTLWFADTQAARDVLSLWIAQEQGCIEAGSGDQEPLAWCILQTSARFLEFPMGYCSIFDSDKRVDKDRYIVHYQASRRLK